MSDERSIEGLAAKVLYRDAARAIVQMADHLKGLSDSETLRLEPGRFLTTVQVALVTGLSVNRLNKMAMEQDGIPFHQPQFRGPRYYRAEDVLDWFEQWRVRSTTEAADRRRRLVESEV